MLQRVFRTWAFCLCIVLVAAAANAQIATSCLRPLAIPDKWVENQTPPWDPTDTFDPTGPNPDVYVTGFDVATDQGTPMELVIYDGTFSGRAAWPVQTGESGGGGFHSDLLHCSGYMHAIGDALPLAFGNLIGPFDSAISGLIAQDPDAQWDPAANNGRGGVMNSAFAQSPRVIALPVFAPDSSEPGSASPKTIVRIVGFFVAGHTPGAVQGFLTGWSVLSTPAVTARPGEFVMLSATFTGPGSPVAGVLIEFLVNDTLVATGLTDGTGTARPATASYNTGSIAPGTYPSAVRVRIGEHAGFFVADDATADLTILKRIPAVTWPALAGIQYGQPLGAEQLNATADVAGQFSYSPAAGTVLHTGEYQTITATFAPANTDENEETVATNYVTVLPAPLTVTVNDSTKMYLDPLPAFGVTYTGFVNGDGPSVVNGSPSFQTSAVATSSVGPYPVSVSGLSASDYSLTYRSGTLTIMARATTSTLQLSTSNPTTYGQALTMTVVVSSGLGTPAGSVVVLDGGASIATAALVNGQVTFTLTSLNAGSHNLSAQYSGSGGFAPSTSSLVTHSVVKANTTTQLASSLNPSKPGQSVTFTAVVSPVAPGGGSPAGNVEFSRAGIVIASVPVSNGTAVFTTSSLPTGKHSIQARYVGSNNHTGSTSAVVLQTVKGGK